MGIVSFKFIKFLNPKGKKQFLQLKKSAIENLCMYNYVTFFFVKLSSLLYNFPQYQNSATELELNLHARYLTFMDHMFVLIFAKLAS